MRYFRPDSLSVDAALVTAWDPQVNELNGIPDLDVKLRSAELFQRFAAQYTLIRGLPRRARRTLMRELARSSRYGAPVAKKIARTVAGAAFLLALAQGAEGATITVNTNIPDIRADGKCSLIEAIINANDGAATQPDCAAGSGDDMIVLPKKGWLVLTSSHVDYYNATGLPVIRSTITIEGDGARITRSQRAGAFRILAVGSGGNLTLNNLTVSGGNTSNRGGGIFARGFLTLNNSIVTGNTAPEGGGIYSVLGGVTINKSTISHNTAWSEGSASGGGIKGFLGPVEIVDSAIFGNRAVGASAVGGGITGYASLVVENSTISGNSAIGASSAGGGIAVLPGKFVIGFRVENSTISHNTATARTGTSYGGGLLTPIDRLGEVSGLIINSVISSNTADVGPEVAGLSSTVYERATITNRPSARSAF